MSKYYILIQQNYITAYQSATQRVYLVNVIICFSILLINLAKSEDMFLIKKKPRIEHHEV
jgi:hypothetical protein